MPPCYMPCPEHALPTGFAWAGAPLVQRHRNLAYQETPVGVEPTRMLLCRQPPYRLAPASYQGVLARNRTWTSTFAELHANPTHPEDVNLVAARRGVEPRLAVSRTAVRSGTLAGCVNQYPDLDLNQDLDLRRVQCNPIHHRDKQSRRLDLHQHEPLYKSGASLSRATSAN